MLTEGVSDGAGFAASADSQAFKVARTGSASLAPASIGHVLYTSQRGEPSMM